MEITHKKPISIVIAGAGFSGVYAYLTLHKIFHRKDNVHITIINKTDYFLFVPLIHEVATGNLLATSIVQPIWNIPQCCIYQFIEGVITHINYDTNTIIVKSNTNSSERTIKYDYALLGLGSQTNYYDTKGALENSLPLKNISDALLIKKRIIEQFERAQCETTLEQERKNLLRFVIVGGGPTGVELTGEIADYINGEFKKTFPHIYKFASLVLLHNGSTLVPQVEPWFSKKAKHILTKKGIVNVLLNEKVIEITSHSVITEKQTIPSFVVIWTAGVKAHMPPYSSKEKIEFEPHTDRIKVNNFLQIPSYKNTFVAGDQAWIYNKETNQPYPMRAQFAIKEGILAAQNMARAIQNKTLKEFSYKDAGIIFSLGKGGAIGSVLGIKWTGPFAWWMYRTAYLFKLVGIRAKLRTALEWTINLFSRRDITKL